MATAIFEKEPKLKHFKVIAWGTGEFSGMEPITAFNCCTTTCMVVCQPTTQCGCCTTKTEEEPCPSTSDSLS